VWFDGIGFGNHVQVQGRHFVRLVWCTSIRVDANFISKLVIFTVCIYKIFTNCFSALVHHLNLVASFGLNGERVFLNPPASN
jgi:hypothetical protein